MDKLSINLLPVELEASKKKSQHKLLISKSSLAVLMTMLILTAFSLLTGIVQRLTIGRINGQIEQQKTAVGSFSRQEALALNLRNRIDLINTVAKKEPLSSQMFNLITTLTPPGVTLAGINSSKGAQTSLIGEGTSAESVQLFFDNLSDPKKTNKKINKVHLESLTSQMKFNLAVSFTDQK